jgi:hypothetical protein
MPHNPPPLPGILTPRVLVYRNESAGRIIGEWAIQGWIVVGDLERDDHLRTNADTAEKVDDVFVEHADAPV